MSYLTNRLRGIEVVGSVDDGAITAKSACSDFIPPICLEAADVIDKQQSIIDELTEALKS